MSIRTFFSRLSQCSRLRKQRNGDTKDPPLPPRLASSTSTSLLKSDIRIIITPATSPGGSDVNLVRAAGDVSATSAQVSNWEMRMRGGDLVCAGNNMPVMQDIEPDPATEMSMVGTVATVTAPTIIPPVATTPEITDEERPWHIEISFAPESAVTSRSSTPLPSDDDSPLIVTPTHSETTTPPGSALSSGNGTLFTTVTHQETSQIGSSSPTLQLDQSSPIFPSDDDDDAPTSLPSAAETPNAGTLSMDHQTAFHNALIALDEPSCRNLISRHDLDVNAPLSNGLTPLSFALEHPRLLSLLLSRADLQLNTSPYIHTAITSHHIAIPLLLQRDDLDTNRLSPSNETALTTAIASGNTVAVKMLLVRKDVDINKSGFKGLPIHIAVRRRDEEVVRLLLRRQDADVNRRDGEGKTPLQVALELGEKSIVEAILGRGDVEVAEDEWGVVARLREKDGGVVPA